MVLVTLEAPKKAQGTYLWTHFCSPEYGSKGENGGE